jgi:hypothetical protein
MLTLNLLARASLSLVCFCQPSAATCREATQPTLHSGFIQEYDDNQDCFVVWDEISRQHCALMFKQFTVEQASSGQLLLKAPSCTYQPLPARFQSLEGIKPAQGTLSQVVSSQWRLAAYRHT